jgi:hypothetical protein
LEHANEYLTDVFNEHRLTFVGRKHRVNFRHRVAKLAMVALNAMQFGSDILVTAPQVPDYYLLQFMLAGSCRLAQGGHSYDMPAGSVAVINPCRPFVKTGSPEGRQLMIRIEQRLVEREFQALTGRDRVERIEFDQSQALTIEKVGTLANYVCMLCNDLRNPSSCLAHPFIQYRIMSALASLLVSMPHRHDDRSILYAPGRAIH